MLGFVGVKSQNFFDSASKLPFASLLLDDNPRAFVRQRKTLAQSFLVSLGGPAHKIAMEPCKPNSPRPPIENRCRTRLRHSFARFRFAPSVRQVIHESFPKSCLFSGGLRRGIARILKRRESSVFGSGIIRNSGFYAPNFQYPFSEKIGGSVTLHNKNYVQRKNCF